ncbi:MAG: hypothetical protein IIC84_06900 [Chloroflexi bacterium]|nr:hypothetical protein [Chloroflexota bacterium]
MEATGVGVTLGTIVFVAKGIGVFVGIGVGVKVGSGSFVGMTVGIEVFVGTASTVAWTRATIVPSTSIVTAGSLLHAANNNSGVITNTAHFIAELPSRHPMP